jgi:hypothetical protein
MGNNLYIWYKVEENNGISNIYTKNCFCVCVCVCMRACRGNETARKTEM